MSQDVSDLKKIEKELLESRTEPERRVEERTATLVQKKMSNWSAKLLI